MTFELILSGWLVGSGRQALRSTHSWFARRLCLIRSRAWSESLCRTGSAVWSGCSWAALRRKSICFPYRRHHLQNERCTRRPNRRGNGSSRSSASDCKRVAVLQSGERSASPLPRDLTILTSQFILAPADQRPSSRLRRRPPSGQVMATKFRRRGTEILTNNGSRARDWENHWLGKKA
jgi:hypothetical protein